MEKLRSNYRGIEEMIKIYKLIAKSYEHSLENAAKFGTDIGIDVDEWRTSIQEYKQLAEWLEELNRSRVLLKATYELLMKQKKSGYVLNLLAETVVYDDAECDGYCLMKDIKALMEEWNDN